MTPLQKVAMGFVLVLVDATFAGYDAVPDPVGWALVVAGVLALRQVLPGAWVLLALAVLSGAVAVATYPPAVGATLDPTLGWLLSLPQLGFMVVACTLLAPRAGHLAPRFRLLRWVLLALVVAPVAVFGGADALVVPTAAAAVLADVYFVYLLFRISRREPAGSPPAPAAAPEQG